jgi:hypothetical protein
LEKVVVPARQATQDGGIDSLEAIPGLLKSFKIRAQAIYPFVASKKATIVTDLILN